jgi:glycosyltransferase involved in cell wall biosynthesis
MATLGRSDEIIILLESLLLQSYKNFELIIVDQNNDDRVTKIFEQYKNKLDLHYYPCDKKGLSLGRNIGLAHISGDIIAFPDDDCEYDHNTLERINIFFSQNINNNFYTCNTKEKHSELSILSGTSGDTIVSLNNIMHVGISFTIFVRATAIKYFAFDEQLGVGAEFGSGEESDLLFFLLKNKNKGFYHSEHYIFHPSKQETIEKAFHYGKGYGALHKKVVVVYRFYRYLFYFLLTLLKETIKICFYPYSKERVSTLRGRIFGFYHYKPIRSLC